MIDVKAALEAVHRRKYEGMIEDMGIEAPSWDELTEEQKVQVRKANDAYDKFMNDLGDEIRGR